MPKKIIQDIISSRRPQKQDFHEGNDEGKRKYFSRRPKGEDGGEDSSAAPRIRLGRRGLRIAKGELHGSFPKIVLWIIAAGAFVFFLFVLLSMFSGTVIEVVPMQTRVSLGGNFTANKNAAEGELQFKLIMLESEATLDIPATEEKEVERKAKGTIVIYNAYSSKSQTLIKNTRFENPDGKIYRINKSIRIPGTTVSGGNIVPGNIEVTVYADFPGEEYNIGLTDFTIPGFKGDPRFKKFYARSKTPMIGGFSGIVKTVSLEDTAEASRTLQNSLKEVLLEQARSQVPENFILYDKAVFFRWDETKGTKVETTEDSVEIVEKGTLYGIILEKDELSAHIAKNTVASYDGGAVSIKEVGELEFNVSNKNGFDPEENSEFDFTLSGPVNIVWKIDKTALVRDLVGIQKRDFLNVIEKYTNIKRAEATIRPFWKRTFPENAERITIRIIEEAS
ncbi:MAG: hypothetical protein BMS9Abin13_075 [Patescibacteria group bacterium]|nr:MAG: hypothetical protein BMS9Abin13_075 [Patescibacteria group bacterium]